jgi:hypothetical protein
MPPGLAPTSRPLTGGAASGTGGRRGPGPGAPAVHEAGTGPAGASVKLLDDHGAASYAGTVS